MNSQSRHDVVVVGAGPAGLAATTRAAAAGLTVALVDAGRRPGGQYWRQPAGPGVDELNLSHLHHDLTTYRQLVADLDREVMSGRVTYIQRHIWTLEQSEEGFVAYAIDAAGAESAATADARKGEPPELRLHAKRLVLAPGAYDRQIPFPGWTLPGVVTAGGAQALLKGHGVVFGNRVLVAGTGPFLLPVAAGLAQAGAQVVGVHEAAPATAWLRHLPAVIRNADKLVEGFGYARALARHRVPVRTRSLLVAAHGTDSVQAVTVARPDGKGGVVAGSHERFQVDAVAVGWGFTPQLELPLALRCATRVDADGSLVCVVDGLQQSSVPGVYIAGEACGVGGAALAVTEGEIAGAAAAGVPVSRALRRRRAALRQFASAIQRAHPVDLGWIERLEPDTVVCRCEEVPTSRLREAVQTHDAHDSRAAKLLVRAGMGWCQGRVCGYASACLTARWSGTGYDPSALSSRPVAAPVTLGTLAHAERENGQMAPPSTKDSDG